MKYLFVSILSMVAFAATSEAYVNTGVAAGFTSPSYSSGGTRVSILGWFPNSSGGTTLVSPRGTYDTPLIYKSQPPTPANSTKVPLRSVYNYYSPNSTPHGTNPNNYVSGCYSCM